MTPPNGTYLIAVVDGQITKSAPADGLIAMPANLFWGGASFFTIIIGILIILLVVKLKRKK